jgi:hypothetical protein
LLLLAWGYFIPVGTFVHSHLHKSSFENHKFGVHFHFVFGAIGLVFAIAGFSYAIKNMTTFQRSNVPPYHYAHAVIGTIATAGAILQLLLMVIMRKPKSETETFHEWPLWQKIGHFSHRGFGFLWIMLAYAALETGTHMTSVNGTEDLENQNEKWSGALLGTVFAAILSSAVIVLAKVFIFSSTESTNSARVAHIDDSSHHHNRKQADAEV